MELSDILDMMVERNAVEAHLRSGVPVVLRADGHLRPVGARVGEGARTPEKPNNLTAGEIAALVASLPDQERVTADLRDRRSSHIRVKLRNALRRSTRITPPANFV